MKEIKTYKGLFLFVHVPDDSYDFEIVMKGRMYIEYRTNNHIDEINTYQPTLKKYKIIGTSKNISEEQAKDIVESYFPFDYDMTMYFKDYIGYKFLKSALESLQTLIISNQLDINKNYLIVNVK